MRPCSAPLAAEQGRRNEVNMGWLAIGALFLRPWPPNKGAEMRPNFHCSGPFSATISAVPKRRSRAPFWVNKVLTQIGAPVLRPRPPNRAPIWPDGSKKIMQSFMAFHAMANQKGKQEEILNKQWCTQKIQTHQYKNKSYASDVSVCNYISSKQHKHKRFTFGACPLEVLRA